MTEIDPSTLPYRDNVGIALFNREGKLFCARRADLRPEVWQCPQGGIDAGETPEEAALRELGEEIGTTNAILLGAHPGWTTYDFPPELIGRRSKIAQKYRGQRQKWFIFGFTGKDSDFRLDAEQPAEFDAWDWLTPDAFLTRNLGFKRAMFETLIPALTEQFKTLSAGWPE